jgi:hypothetical protein
MNFQLIHPREKLVAIKNHVHRTSMITMMVTLLESFQRLNISG